MRGHLPRAMRAAGAARVRRRFSDMAVPGREPVLFTPGPLTTSLSVKSAMLRDLGSRDRSMVAVIQDVRDRLLRMAGVSKQAGFECVLQQGSGTFVVESVVSSVVPPPSKGGRILVVSNGAYGVRMAKMCQTHGMDYEVLQYDETSGPTVEDVVGRLRDSQGRRYTHVGVVHHETTAGTLNPIEPIGRAIREFDRDISFIVDSMSGFGAYSVDLQAANVHYLVSSANKNLEGVPGFGFILCSRERLQREGANARSVSLDVLEQWQAMEGNGQFRFTPPTHALLAFQQALLEHEAEGGSEGRLARYTANFTTLKAGMAQMGFHPYLAEDKQGVIITTFLFPDDPNFRFETFYSRLSDRGMVIYPGKLTKADCFRIGTIGRLFPHDVTNLLAAVREILEDMSVALPVRQVTPAAASSVLRSFA
eukprot:CAMPEP_0175358558 /NCGR_PEP_ID=MMETSP0095-20121207/15061_1 /TAXON_ID=311494 /ORGANISM="Alexandrium monilatum, Strain CCMP3105" /LENGTH=420 /DNA_ID=CAMNT_0016656293 /DNA_START=58 /DNA_END=1320 /DNA_ORIENTATION=+